MLSFSQFSLILERLHKVEIDPVVKRIVNDIDQLRLFTLQSMDLTINDDDLASAQEAAIYEIKAKAAGASLDERYAMILKILGD